jgi:hypothetical protein
VARSKVTLTAVNSAVPNLSSLPISEIGVPLAAFIYDLGMQLLEIASLKIGTLSKSERGYQLAFDTATATKAMPSGVSAEHTIDAAGSDADVGETSWRTGPSQLCWSLPRSSPLES